MARDVVLDAPFGKSISFQFGLIPLSRIRCRMSIGDMGEALRISVKNQRWYRKAHQLLFCVKPMVVA